jgi:hypothetical protein
MESQIQKELYINHFGIPSEITDIIKQYCFYDVKSAKMIRQIKEYKRHINFIFRNYSLKLTNDEYDEDREEWGISFIPESGELFEMYGLNCHLCGDYVFFPNQNTQIQQTTAVNLRIMCNCTFWTNTLSIIYGFE